MIATIITALLLTQTPVTPAKAEAKPDAEKAPNTRWADGTGTAKDGLSIQSPVILLVWPQVRKEIGLTGKQYAEVLRAVNVGEKQWHDELTRNLDAGKLHLFNDAPVIIAAKRKASRRAMATVMTPAQVRRLHEVSHQIWGIEALASDLELQNALNLSETQRENIKAAKIQYSDEPSKLSQESSKLKSDYKRSLRRPPTPEEERAFRIKNANVFESHDKRERELAAAFTREINRQLTKRQRAAFEKAKGKPFDFDGMTAPGSRERNEQKEAERKAKEKTADPPDKAAAR